MVDDVEEFDAARIFPQHGSGPAVIEGAAELPTGGPIRDYLVGDFLEVGRRVLIVQIKFHAGFVLDDGRIEIGGIAGAVR